MYYALYFRMQNVNFHEFKDVLAHKLKKTVSSSLYLHIQNINVTKVEANSEQDMNK